MAYCVNYISTILYMPAIRVKVEKAKDSVGQDAIKYVERVIRYCWGASLSPVEIAEGLGMKGKNAVSRLSSACKGAHKVGLLKSQPNGRYIVDQEEIERLKTLSELRKG